MNRNVWLLVGGVVLIGAFGYQQKRIMEVHREIASLRGEIQGVQTVEPGPAAAVQRPISIDNGVSAGLGVRLANLERTVESLAKVSNALMDRGMIPPTQERLAEIQQRFFDPTAPDNERLRALRMLRRGQQVDENVVMQAVNWLQTSTNGGTRRELLQQLDGVTNASLKQPLLALLQTETAGNVRQELVDVLADYADDPAVEAKLWELATSDTNGRVREEAQEALTEGKMTPERIENLRQRAANPNASLDERLLSLRGLREADVQAPEVVTQIASLAQTTTDPVMRAKVYRALDGINDQSLMAPLVNGLQDPNPIVRESAADALGSFASDPRIQEWLNHVIQNDTDPRVKREAHQALEQSQRRGPGRGERRGR